jgi:hypothetical protein
MLGLTKSGLRVSYQDGISWDLGPFWRLTMTRRGFIRAMTAFLRTLCFYWTRIVGRPVLDPTYPFICSVDCSHLSCY